MMTAAKQHSCPLWLKTPRFADNCLSGNLFILLCTQDDDKTVVEIPDATGLQR